MPRHLIREASSGRTIVVRDAALPFFPGWIVLDTLDDNQPAYTYYDAAQADFRYVNVTELGDPASPAREVLDGIYGSAPTTDAAKEGFVPSRLADDALKAALVPFWAPAETVTAGKIRMAPDGKIIQRNADGTTRASYDATEQAAWTVVSGGAVADGSITPAKLSFNPATQNELNLAKLKGSPRIRAMAASPPYAPPIMTTPPTVTQGASVTSGLTYTVPQASVRWSEPLSPTPSVVGSMQPRGYQSVAGNPFWNAQTSQVAFDFDEQLLDIHLKAHTATRYRIWVNEQAATAGLVTPPTPTTGNIYLKIDFGSASPGDPRRIVIEFESQTTPMAIINLFTVPTAALIPPSIPSPRVALVADSYGVGTGGSLWSYGYARSLARLMGWGAMRSGSTSLGNTGFVTGADHYLTRLPYDIIPFDPDLVIIQGSINDAGKAGVAAAVTTYVNTLRASLPDTAVVLTSPLYVAAPQANMLTLATELQTTAAALGIPYIDAMGLSPFTGTGKVGATTGDGNADKYRNNDGTHPSDAGHFMLARIVAGLLGQALNLPT